MNNKLVTFTEKLHVDDEIRVRKFNSQLIIEIRVRKKYNHEIGNLLNELKDLKAKKTAADLASGIASVAGGIMTLLGVYQYVTGKNSTTRQNGQGNIVRGGAVMYGSNYLSGFADDKYFSPKLEDICQRMKMMEDDL